MQLRHFMTSGTAFYQRLVYVFIFNLAEYRWRIEKFPILEIFNATSKPFIYTDLTVIDVLPKADKTDHYGPILVTVHNAVKQVRFADSHRRIIMFPSHFFLIPNALGFIKNQNVFRGRSIVR